MLDSEGKMRLEYIIDIGEGKGTFPPTPHLPETLNDSSVILDIPDEAIEFATQSLKRYLLTLNEQEADCTSP